MIDTVTCPVSSATDDQSSPALVPPSGIPRPNSGPIPFRVLSERIPHPPEQFPALGQQPQPPFAGAPTSVGRRQSAISPKFIHQTGSVVGRRQFSRVRMSASDDRCCSERRRRSRPRLGKLIFSCPCRMTNGAFLLAQC
jgi:hypothetical protein